MLRMQLTQKKKINIMNNYKVLVIDDDIQVREALQTLLERNHYSVSTASSGSAGLKQVRESDPDLVLSDIMMPEMDGVEMLKRLKKMVPDLPVVLMTGYSSIEGAVKAIRHGADEYLTKPLDHVEVLHVIEKAQKQQQLSEQNKMLRQRLAQKPRQELIGESPELKKVKQEIAQSANSNISVLILGESGTGKELIAEAIHRQSARNEEPSVAINCAAIPNDLLESELFGHEKGAFSGATVRKYGLFEMANRGTLFLDEIGEMSLPLQSKILRALETQKIRRIGSTKEISTDFRLICSTNLNIQKAMDEGSFRTDLYYRISPFIITVSPLRERASDLPLLLQHFVAVAGYPHLQWEDEFLKALTQYRWPGNIRELKNVIDRAVLIGDGQVLRHADLGLHILDERSANSKSDPTKILTLAEVEQQHIANTVRSVNNKTKAAEALGISLKTLYNKLHSYTQKGG